MKTLAEINAILGTETASDLTQLIGAIKAAVRDSGAGVIADLNAKLVADATAAVDAAKAASESHATELAKLTASHAEAIAAKDAEHLEAIAAKDAQLKAQEDEAWEAIKASANNHADIVNELEYKHAADLAKAAADLASAVEAEGRAVHNRLDALVQAGQEAHAAGDLDALGKVLVAAYAHTSKARKAKLEADLAIAQAAVTAAADKLAAL
jgi:hypothetical protein